MGGVVSDLYMRLYPKDDLFSAVIPLSTVADSLPGGSLSQKLEKDNEIATKNLINSQIPAGERNLGESLARQNKISPVCGMYCSMLMLGLDWTPPPHKGQDYLPALYIIGKGDALYQGYETSFHQHLESLSNVTLKVYDQRRDIKDKDGSLPSTSVGHLIFDHRPHVYFEPSLSLDARKKIINGQIKEDEFKRLNSQKLIKMDPEFTYKDLADPETFVLIRNFIGQVTKQDLSTKERFQPPTLATIMQAWANNLIFREFASSYIYSYARATQETASLGTELGMMHKRINELRGKEKRKVLTDEEASELNRLGLRQREILDFLGGKGDIPADKVDLFNQLDLISKDLLEKEIGPNNHLRKDLKTKYENLKQDFSRHEKLLQSLEDFLSSPHLDKIRFEREHTFREIMDQDTLVRILTERYLLENFSDGTFKKQLFESLPPEVLTAFEKYDSLSNRYQKNLHKFQNILIAEASSGALTIDPKHFKEAVDALPQSVKKPQTINELQSLITTTSRELSHLLSEQHRLTKEIEYLEESAAKLLTKLHRIQDQKAQISGTKYFTTEKHTIQSLIELSAESIRNNPEQLSDLNNLLQRIWSEWQKLWSETYNRIFRVFILELGKGESCLISRTESDF
jgi:hypothetical protein